MLLIRFNAAKIGIYFKPAYVFTTLNKTFLINLIYIVTHFWYILYRSSRDQEEIKKRSRFLFAATKCSNEKRRTITQ